MIRTNGDVSISVVESEKRKIENPDYLLKMDNIEMKNGEKYLVTNVDSGEVELMMITRKRIKKEDISNFLKDMSFVERSDCFEIG